MEDLSLKMGLVELYQLVGDNTGVSFLYDELPGVVVTIGFTLEEDEQDDDGTDGDGGDEPNDGGTNGTKRSVH